MWWAKSGKGFDVFFAGESFLRLRLVRIIPLSEKIP
jgi:hypothetical protein